MKDTQTAENTEAVEQIKKLLKLRSKQNFNLALGNIEIGRIISQACDKIGDAAVPGIASMLARDGFRISEEFLYGTARVHRSIGNEHTLRTLSNKISGGLTWGFLLDKCTKAPEGDSPEAKAYWEKIFSRIENTLGQIDDLRTNAASLPEDIKNQAQGLIAMAETETAAPREPLRGPINFGLMDDTQVTERLTFGGKEYRFDPETGYNMRLIDNARCIGLAVDTMISRMCRFMVWPGDVMDNYRPWPNEEAFVLREIVKLTKQMPVIVFPGNHDLPRNPQDHSALQFLRNRDNVIVVDRPTILYLEGRQVRTEPSATWPQQDCAKIFIMPFPARNPRSPELTGKTMAEVNSIVSDTLERTLKEWAGLIDPNVPNLLFGHFTVTEAQGVNESMVEFDPHVRLIFLEPFDFVGLGHIHTPQRVGVGHIYYAGSSDRMGFDEENDTKTFMITTMRGRTPEPEFIELPARKYRTLQPEAFDSEDWASQFEPSTIYRVKGTVTKDRYIEIGKKMRSLPKEISVTNALSVESDIRVRDAEMTETLTDSQAFQRFITEHLEIEDKEFADDVLRAFNTLITEEETA